MNVDRSAGRPMNVDLLIAGGIVVTMDPERRVLPSGAVAVSGNRIVAVGDAAEVERACTPVRRIAASGRMVLPGFVNLHSHTGLTIMRGIGEDKGSASLYPPVTTVWDIMGPEDIHALSSLGFYELLRFGSTTVVENFRHMGAVADAAERLGVRAVLSEIVSDVDQPGIAAHGYRFDSRLGDAALGRGLELADRWHGRAGGRLTVQLSPHAPDFCSRELLETIAGEARRRGLQITLHVAQTPREVEQVRRLHGRGSVELLDEIGMLGPHVIGAHCIYVSESEIARLAASGTGVAHNASINAKRGRITPAVEILERGGTVGLGTDNYHGNISEAWKFAISGARVRTGDALRLTPMQVLEMATVNGARALGRLHELGSLEPGKLADVVVVDLQRPHFYPLIEPVGALVHNMVGNDVETVIVDGVVRMSDRRIPGIDLAAVRAEAQAAGEEVWSRLPEWDPLHRTATQMSPWSFPLIGDDS